MNNLTSSISVAQIGARRHYALAVYLHHHGLLNQLYTDVYMPYTPDRYRQFFPRSIKRLLGRSTPEIPLSTVTQFPLAAVRLQIYKYNINIAARIQRQTAYASLFAQKVAKDILKRVNDSTCPDTIIAFQNGALEIFERIPPYVKKLYDQFDGSYFEYEIVHKEKLSHPQWEGEPDIGYAELFQPLWSRHKIEWRLADAIICNSQHTLDCITRFGAPKNKCAIIPLMYAAPINVTTYPAPLACANSLKVLFLGTLCLRKGTHYLIQAAKTVHSAGINIQLSLAGGCNLKQEKLKQELFNAPYITYLGHIPRGQVPRLISQHDCLCLPSIAEGFGIVQLEALALGRPVVASTACGEVVRDGVEGLLVEPGNVEQLAEALFKLAADKTLLAYLTSMTRKRVEDFLPEKIGAAWLELSNTKE